MKLIRTIYPDLFPSSGCVLTIGNFDAVHLGHQDIVRRLVDKGQAQGLPAVMITFSPSPQQFFKGEEAGPELTSITARYLLLDNSGLDALIVLPFNKALANTSAEDFIEKYIIQGLHTRYLLIGDDFRFGARRTGNYQMLVEAGQSAGFKVDRIETVSLSDERISSSRVRMALRNGDLDVVSKLIGRPYSMVGRVAHGDKRGRQWGFPTLNLPLRKTPPLRGVFSVVVKFENGDQVNGVANLGNRPTVNGLKTLLEVHLFDFSGEVYSQRVCVEFIQKIRDEQKFDSFDDLKKQIMNDCETARVSLNNLKTETLNHD